MTSHRIFARVACSALALICVVGCANNPQVEALQRAATALQSPGSLLRTQAEVDAYPYAQLQMQLTGYLPAIAVLAEYAGEDHVWVAGGAFALRQAPDGRIKRMQVGTSATSVQWKGVMLQPTVPTTYKLAVTLAGESQQPTVLAVACSLSESVAASIIVNSRTIDTTRSRYECVSEGDEAAHAMTYWHDASGRIRRAEGKLWSQGQGYLFEALKVPA